MSSTGRRTTERSDFDGQSVAPSRAMVPLGLCRWFVIHFIADVVSAVPLFVAPEWFLGQLGWPAADPISTRSG